MEDTVKLQNRQIIKCPHCGWEYLPGELLYPDSVVGQPKNVIRDTLGKIIYEDYKPYKSPESEEHYTCDNCNRQFVIEIETKYKAKVEEEALDFSQQFVSLL